MRYTKLIVSGCSFTENVGSWAYNLASKYDLELVNLAYPGAGNHHIAWSLMSYLEKNQSDLDECLVGIMWSHPIRDDFIYEINHSYKDQSMYTYNYDRHNRLVMRGDLMKKYDHITSLKVKEELIKESLVGNYNKSAMTFTTWFLQTSVISYLLRKKVNFFQTMFHNYFTKSDLITNNTDWHLQREYEYLYELTRINLSPELTNWIDLDKNSYLGEFAYHNRLLTEDNYHPNLEGHLLWTEQILIPKLIEMKLVP